MVTRLDDLFPKLRGARYRITAPPDPTYNCLAWAAGVNDAWWWPVGDPGHVYWPINAANKETLEALKAAFVTLGYAECDHDQVEPGYEKVAFFANESGAPTHAARQHPTGVWTSKIGQLECIDHALCDLEGDEYGTVALLMKRPRTIAKD